MSAKNLSVGLFQRLDQRLEEPRRLAARLHAMIESQGQRQNRMHHHCAVDRHRLVTNRACGEDCHLRHHHRVGVAAEQGAEIRQRQGRPHHFLGWDRSRLHIGLNRMTPSFKSAEVRCPTSRSTGTNAASLYERVLLDACGARPWEQVCRIGPHSFISSLHRYNTFSANSSATRAGERFSA